MRALLNSVAILSFVLTCGQCCNRIPTEYNTVSLGDESVKQCGYKSCDLGKPDLINVHLIPHSHDDVGWLKTVDQYYYGSKNQVAEAGVQYVLDSVIVELLKDPKRRFIYVEIAFFYRWWNEQDDATKETVKQLVNEGRLEFILGGWCMNDEATTHYNAIIDQQTLGMKFLQDNFGECGRPRAAWQIDPFGHSKEQASLFAQMGFDGLFFARLDEQDRANRKATKTMEMIWQGSNNLGAAANLFTGAFHTYYTSPTGFCFDTRCRDQPIMDDDELHDNNVKGRVNTFIKMMTEMSSKFATNHYIQTMGTDFSYMNANMNFKNIDKLIKYVNAQQSKGSKINLLYSTPTCYIYAVNQANHTWPTKTDDFFPYASGSHTYWTGYFTSRPALKRYVRKTNNFLQVCKQLATLAELGDEYRAKVDVLKRAMAVAQHHDAVSGTEYQNVADDYALRLANGTAECQEVVSVALQKLMTKAGALAQRQYFCDLLNISMCTFTETVSNFSVTIYNPLARPVVHWLWIPVPEHRSLIRMAGRPKGSFEYQVVDIDNRTRSIPERKGSKAVNNVLARFVVPQLSFVTIPFVLKKRVPKKISDSRRITRVIGSRTRTVSKRRNNRRKKQVISIENQHIRIDVDPSTGMISSMTNKDKAITIPLQQSLRYYSSSQGKDVQPSFPPSGAYVFRPIETAPRAIGTKVTNTYVQGKLVQELRQSFAPWATQVLRLYDDEKYAELEWTVGPIPVDDKQGKEVVAYFKTGLETNKTFYTDANGREMQKRIRNFRPTWKLGVNEPVAGNYYPINSRIYIRDEISKTAQFTIMTDRSLGGASIEDGDLEIMVHRRLVVQARGGMREPLNEKGSDKKGLIVRGKMYLLLDAIADSGQLHRDLGERLFMAPMVTFGGTAAKENRAAKKVSYSGLKRALPPNVHLLTLEQWRAGTFLLRLEHFYEKHDHPNLSNNVTFSLKGLFEPFDIESLEELILGANQKLSDANRLKWKYNSVSKESKNEHGLPIHQQLNEISNAIPMDDLDVTLSPMQIRTFQVTVAQ